LFIRVKFTLSVLSMTSEAAYRWWFRAA